MFLDDHTNKQHLIIGEPTGAKLMHKQKSKMKIVIMFCMVARITEAKLVP